MNDFVTSLIRQYVPILVGYIAAWLVTIGVELDSDTQAALILALGGIASAVYYGIVRALELRWPSLGALLGRRAQPEYASRVDPAGEHRSDNDY